MASLAGWDERAVGHFEAAIAAHVKAGRVVDAARVTASARHVAQHPRPGRAGDRPDPRGAGVNRGQTAPPEVIADLQARLGGALVFSGHVDEATAAIEVALTLAQHHELAELFAYGLNPEGRSSQVAGRAEEARAAFEMSADVARRQRDHSKAR